MDNTFKALNDSTRREILKLLKEQELTAGEIVEKFPDLTNATISHHLSTLKKANLVTDRKEGKYIVYEINMSVLQEVIEWFIGGFK